MARSLKEEQQKLSKKLIIKDSIKETKTIAGVDQAFFDNKIISYIVVMDSKLEKIVEKKHAIIDAPMKYIRGYLAFREGPAIIEAYNKLENKPDVLIVGGHGIAHLRKMGLASYVGVVLDIPVIGIAKKLLHGTLEEGKIYIDEDMRGEVVFTKEKANPLFVSPGNKVSIKKSVEIVKNSIKHPHKLPEPVHLAHKFSKKLRIKLEQDKG